MSLEPLERLLSIVPAPASPTAARGNWALVEADLGTKLPGDWKALIERYGHGQFDDSFHLGVAAASARRFTLSDGALVFLRARALHGAVEMVRAGRDHVRVEER